MAKEIIVVGGGTNPHIEVSLLGSGYAAIMVAKYKDIGDDYDVVQTGIGRYKTREEAVKEGKEWAEAEEMEFKDNGH